MITCDVLNFSELEKRHNIGDTKSIGGGLDVNQRSRFASSAVIRCSGHVSSNLDNSAKPVLFRLVVTWVSGVVRDNVFRGG